MGVDGAGAPAASQHNGEDHGGATACKPFTSMSLQQPGNPGSEEAARPRPSPPATSGGIEWRLIERRFKVRGRLLEVAVRIVEDRKHTLIARELGLTVPTVRTYYERLCALLGVPRSRTAVVRRLYEASIEHLQHEHRRQIEALEREIEGLKRRIAAAEASANPQ